MPADHVYGLKIVDDISGGFEYSPPFQLSVPGSVFTSGMAVNLLASSTSAPGSSQTSSVTTGTSAQPKTTNTAAQTSTTGSPSSTGTDATPTSSSDSPLDMGPSASGVLSPQGIPNLAIIFGATASAVGGLMIIIVVACVWARVVSDKKKIELYGDRIGKSFRDRYSYDDDTPITGHHRFPSTSSFGDGARASMVFEAPKRSPTSTTRSFSPPPSPFAAPIMKFPAPTPVGLKKLETHTMGIHKINTETNRPPSISSPVNSSQVGTPRSPFASNNPFNYAATSPSRYSQPSEFRASLSSPIEPPQLALNSRRISQVSPFGAYQPTVYQPFEPGNAPSAYSPL